MRTTMFGADYSRGPLTVGLSVGRTLGLGGSRATGRGALAFKADALLVTVTSELLFDGPTGGRLNVSEARVARVRTALGGSRGFTLVGGQAVADADGRGGAAA